MARQKKGAPPIHGLTDEQVKSVRSGIEQIEKIEEAVAQKNADKRVALDRLTGILEPLGYSKRHVTEVIKRRKRDRDRVKGDDLCVRKLEAALGMATADIFDEAENTMKSSQDGAEVVEASLAAGNAAPADDDEDDEQGDEPTVETDEPADQAPAEMDSADAENLRNEGRAAWGRSVPYGNCPYALASRERTLWEEGWNFAQEDWDRENAAAANVVPFGDKAAATAY